MPLSEGSDDRAGALLTPAGEQEAAAREPGVDK